MVHQDVPNDFITQDNPFMIIRTYQNQITPETVHKTNKSIAYNSTVSTKTPLSPLIANNETEDTKYEKWLTKVDIEDTIQRMSI